MKKAIITVIGVDKIGIIAKISVILADNDINILDINQTVMQDNFTMMMAVDISKSKLAFNELSDRLKEAGLDIGLQIKIYLEEIFTSMHRI